MRDWFRGLERREQRTVVIGGIVAAIMLFYVGLLMPLEAAVDKRETRVAELEDDVSYMQQTAGRIKALQQSAPGNATDAARPLVVIVDRTARDAQLSNTLTSSQPVGQNGILVRFESASFDTLIEWLGRLNGGYGVRVREARFDQANTRGLVNATLTLERPAG